MHNPEQMHSETEQSDNPKEAVETCCERLLYHMFEIGLMHSTQMIESGKQAHILKDASGSEN